MENQEIYDPLANKSTLVIYMIQSGEKWVEINSDELAIGNQMVRNLRVSYDHRSHPQPTQQAILATHTLRDRILKLSGNAIADAGNRVSQRNPVSGVFEQKRSPIIAIL